MSRARALCLCRLLYKLPRVLVHRRGSARFNLPKTGSSAVKWGGGVFQVRRSSERPEKCRATPLRKIPVTKSIDSWKPEMSGFFRVSAGKQRFNFLLTFTFLFCERLERYDVQAINSCKTPNLVCQTPKLSCSGALAVFSSRLRG